VEVRPCLHVLKPLLGPGRGMVCLFAQVSTRSTYWGRDRVAIVLFRAPFMCVGCVGNPSFGRRLPQARRLLPGNSCSPPYPQPWGREG
jgi:hypothetical protein